MRKKAIIIGGGPVGLSAAYQLLTRTEIIPIVLEQSGVIEGLNTSYKISRMEFGLQTLLSRLIRLLFTPKTSLASCEQLNRKPVQYMRSIYASGNLIYSLVIIFSPPRLG